LKTDIKKFTDEIRYALMELQ